jgi:hypothetical protein
MLLSVLHPPFLQLSVFRLTSSFMLTHLTGLCFSLFGLPMPSPLLFFLRSCTPTARDSVDVLLFIMDVATEVVSSSAYLNRFKPEAPTIPEHLFLPTARSSASTTCSACPTSPPWTLSSPPPTSTSRASRRRCLADPAAGVGRQQDHVALPTPRPPLRMRGEALWNLVCPVGHTKRDLAQ